MLELSAEQVVRFYEAVERNGSGGVQPFLSAVLTETRGLLGAEAGTIFVRGAQGAARRTLRSVVAQNDAVALPAEPIEVAIDRSSVAGYVAATGETLVIDDVYALPPGAPYRFSAANEIEGYRTRSVLAFALRDMQGGVLGVVELINRLDADGRPAPFRGDAQAVAEIVSRVAGPALGQVQLIEQLRSSGERLRRAGQAISMARRDADEALLRAIEMLSRAAELYDEGTGNHVVRVNEYSYLLARLAGLPGSFCRTIRYSAQLHDVGKLSVDAAVLTKCGPLDERERAMMREHTRYGYEILSGSPRLEMGAEIAWCHHERWDGSGYPRGLRGEAIPISARIVALADVYDALRSERAYKRGYSHAEAVAVIRDGDDRLDPHGHFDPNLRRLFLEHADAFDAIWERLADEPHDEAQRRAMA